jgi:hypothetical protein
LDFRIETKLSFKFDQMNGSEVFSNSPLKNMKLGFDFDFGVEMNDYNWKNKNKNKNKC